MKMKYSRELRNMIYFEVYNRDVVSSRGRVYIRYDGLVLSSFRPVSVLSPRDVDDRLRVERRRKYVLVGRSSSNPSIYLTPQDVVVSIYDRKKLKKVTGKEYTIPERIRMRLSTLGNVDEVRVSRVFWEGVPEVVHEFVEFSWVYPVDVVLVLLYRSGKGGLGMKMFRFAVDEGENLDLKWVKKLNYWYGYVFRGAGYISVVSGYSKYVSFSDVHEVFSSVYSRKGREQVSFSEDRWLFDEEEGASLF